MLFILVVNFFFFFKRTPKPFTLLYWYDGCDNKPLELELFVNILQTKNESNIQQCNCNGLMEIYVFDKLLKRVHFMAFCGACEPKLFFLFSSRLNFTFVLIINNILIQLLCLLILAGESEVEATWV